MDKLAEKYIEDHKNPLVKVELTGTKLFLKSSSNEESEYIEKYLNNLEKVLRKERVERRFARSVAIYSPEDKIISVKKIIGSILSHFGFQNKNGKFLFAEEALFLLETNRLEIFMNEVPLSIKEAYEILLNHESNCTCQKYKVYKKLANQGYRLIRKTELDRIKLNNIEKRKDVALDCSTTNKRKSETLVDELEEVVKRSKQNEQDISIKEKELISKPTEKLSENERDIIIKEMNMRFEGIRKLGPKKFTQSTFRIVPDYCVFLPSNSTKVFPDFYLCIISEMRFNRHCFEEEIPHVFAVCTEDNIAFYRFSNVELPNL